MKLKERTTRVFVSSMLSFCMVFSVMPNIPVKAAKEEDSIQRLVCSYMDSREMAVTEGDAGNLENVAVCGIVDDEAVHRSVLAKSGISISDTSFKIMDIANTELQVQGCSIHIILIKNTGMDHPYGGLPDLREV